MKVDNVVPICYCFAAVCFYITAIINFVGKNTSMGVVYMCLGSTMLCLSTVWSNIKKGYDEDAEENEDAETREDKETSDDV